VHGTRAYSEAVERTLEVTRAGAVLLDAAPHLDLIMDPVLSVLAFRRIGWEQADYDAWSVRLMEDGTAFVLPTEVDGEPALRICIVNPLTTVDDIDMILDSLA
jgi:glutamate/tyrosine decarboxylase-like PLP-dependent enzyme